MNASSHLDISSTIIVPRLIIRAPRWIELSLRSGHWHTLFVGGSHSCFQGAFKFVIKLPSARTRLPVGPRVVVPTHGCLTYWLGLRRALSARQAHAPRHRILHKQRTGTRPVLLITTVLFRTTWGNNMEQVWRPPRGSSGRMPHRNRVGRMVGGDRGGRSESGGTVAPGVSGEHIGVRARIALPRFENTERALDHGSRYTY